MSNDLSESSKKTVNGFNDIPKPTVQGYKTAQNGFNTESVITLSFKGV